MSKLIIVLVPGDIDVFRRSLTEYATDYERIAADARMEGALHHRFGVTDDAVMIVDEWESEEAFRAFFSRPELQAFIGKVGGDLSAEPEITVTEAITSPDQF
jgi:heme-degrading monooxygenase HmoA